MLLTCTFYPQLTNKKVYKDLLYLLGNFMNRDGCIIILKQGRGENTRRLQNYSRKERQELCHVLYNCVSTNFNVLILHVFRTGVYKYMQCSLSFLFSNVQIVCLNDTVMDVWAVAESKVTHSSKPKKLYMLYVKYHHSGNFCCC